MGTKQPRRLNQLSHHEYIHLMKSRPFNAMQAFPIVINDKFSLVVFKILKSHQIFVKNIFNIMYYELIR